MKKFCSLLLALLLLTGCSAGTEPAKIVDTVTTPFATYYELSDGTWKTDEYTYKYRLEISGQMPNAAKTSTFVYLSNLETITFDEAWRAAGLSSSMDDYFSPEEATFVDWN